MKNIKQLRELAWEQIRSAKSLLALRHWNNAANLCGFAVELVLKARICVDLGIIEYPDDAAEFNLSKFKTMGWKLKEIFSHDKY